MGMDFNGDKVSSLNAYLRDPKAKRVMISFYYYKFSATARFIADGLLRWNEENPDARIDIMVDSGAFSLMANEDKMKTINIDEYTKEYGAFITKYEKSINRFIELDIQVIAGVQEYERLYMLLNENTTYNNINY